MSIRAVILGLVIGLSIAAFGYIVGTALALGTLVGNYFPASIYGLLILVCVGVNPLLRRLRPAWVLRPGELAVAMAISLAACSVPGLSGMRYFTAIQAMPAMYNRTEPAMAEHNLEQYIPTTLMPDHRDSRRVLDPLQGGLGSPGKRVGVDAVPWDAWSASLSAWLTLMVLLGGALVCLAVVIHRQWSVHEGLKYPLAAIAVEVMATDPATGRGKIAGRGLFWVGLIAVLTIHLLNAFATRYRFLPEIPLQFNMKAMAPYLMPQAPMLSHCWWILLLPTLYFCVIGIAYFVPPDVSFSLGISHWLYILVGMAYLGAGGEISYDFIEGRVRGWQYFGAYLGLGLVILYTGRSYYAAVLRRVVGLTPRAADAVPPYAVWAARGFLVLLAALATAMVSLGLEWPIAILVVALLVLLFVVVSRMVAEAGAFWVFAGWLPTSVIIGLYGRDTLGPGPIILMGLIVSMLAVNPAEALMPFVVNGLRLGEMTAVRPPRLAAWSGAMFLLALAVAVPVTLWANYNYGLTTDGWSREVAKRPLDTGLRSAEALDRSGDLASVQAMGPLERLASAHPSRTFLAAAGVGVALVLVCSLLRFRVPWWPIHPIIFLGWGEWPFGHMSFSFLVGWAIRSIAIRLGGTGAYERLKPLMIGVVAGELLAGFVLMAVNLSSFALQGPQGQPLRIGP